MRFPAWMLFAVCFLCYGIPAHAQATASSKTELPSVDAILEKSITATGGQEAWLKLTSMQIKAELTIDPPGLSGVLTMSSKAPDKESDCMVFAQGIFFCRAYDGNSGWQDDSRDGLKPLEGKDLEDMRRQADFYTELHQKEHYSELKVLSEQDFDGLKVYVLAGTRKDGAKQELYFAKDSGLHVGTKDLSENEEDVKTTFYEDYKQTAGPGILIATKIRVVSTKMNMRMVIQEISPNIDLSDSMFVKPAKSGKDAASTGSSGSSNRENAAAKPYSHPQ